MTNSRLPANVDNGQIVHLNSDKISDIITKIPNLTDKDKRELMLRIASDDIEVRKKALEKITQSQIAHQDFMFIMDELAAWNKKGVYIGSKQRINTGSGTFDIEIKGGDSRLIIPVLIIVAIVLIVVLIIVFK
jgi:hypothetical protein